MTGGSTWRATCGSTATIGSGTARRSTPYYSWGDIIERASRDSRIAPGDVIGSGTVGGGSIRESIRKGYENARWLEPGDVVEMEVEHIGVLRETNWGRRSASTPTIATCPVTPLPRRSGARRGDYRYHRTR